MKHSTFPLVPADERRTPFPFSEEKRNYWLSHCQGFRVEGPDGYIGTVEDVRFESRRDRPDELDLCCGRLRLRSHLVGVDDVVAVVPRETRILLARAPGGSRAGQGRRGRRIWHRPVAPAP